MSEESLSHRRPFPSIKILEFEKIRSFRTVLPSDYLSGDKFAD